MQRCVFGTINTYPKIVFSQRMDFPMIKNMAEEYGNDLIEISDHGTESEICKPFEGNTYSISGNTPG